MTPRLAALSLCIAVVGTSACEPSSRIEGRTQALAGDRRAVIIHFSRQVDLAALAASGREGRQAMIEALRRDAERTQSRAAALMRRRGIEPSARLWMINALVATLPEPLIDEIARMPEVESVEPDRLTTAPVADSGSATTFGWNLSAIRAPELWATGQRGSGSVVAVLDTGADVNHPDLASSWRTTAGWYDPYGQHPTPADRSGHGTQVLGLVVGGDASGQAIGVAPGAQWIGARIYDDAGVGTVSGIHLALQWVLDPDGNPATDDAADVVNASWGFSELVNECYLEFEPDLATLRAAQIASVFAAGNSGPYASSSMSPANNPSSFAAGAIDLDRAVVASSSRGPDACTGAIYPEMVAPGADVRTSDLTQGGVFPNSYVNVSGTSFAASHLAGAMALLLGAHPEATVSQLEEALTATAVDLAAAGADNDSGFGLPDLVAAEARLAILVATPACTDADGDGYFAEPNCGTALDCDDAATSIHPGACDIRGDGIDQDCNGMDRLKGKNCPR